jgi:hypothetical protein
MGWEFFRLKLVIKREKILRDDDHIAHRMVTGMGCEREAPYVS